MCGVSAIIGSMVVPLRRVAQYNPNIAHVALSPQEASSTGAPGAPVQDFVAILGLDGWCEIQLNTFPNPHNPLAVRCWGGGSALCSTRVCFTEGFSPVAYTAAGGSAGRGTT